MKAFIASLLLVAAVVGLTSAVGATGSPDRPPGVAANDWIPISDSLGIVVLHRDRVAILRSHMPNLGALPPPIPGADGYFMVKDRGDWRRLVVVEPYRVEPTGN